MKVNQLADEIPERSHDDRITCAGKFLRKNRLDDLPMLFNVLAGDMSIVGPRPHMLADCCRFSFLIPDYGFRHLLKPGITGWAQVNGWHGPIMDYERIKQRFYWDAEYVRKAGIRLDLRIIAATIRKALQSFSPVAEKTTTLE